MSISELLKYAYLVYFSKPAVQRALHRAVYRHQVTSIVEVGVGDGQRARRLIRTALSRAADEPVRYTGIDLFEARGSECPGLSLKNAHCLLKSLRAKIKLVPGDPFGGLARSANALAGTDLLIISADQDAEAMANAWFYVPRMLHERSLVFVEQPATESGPGPYQLLAADEIAARASTRSRAA